MEQNKLTKEEEKVIVHKGTEPPFSGKYNDFFEEGIYACRRCGNPLFDSAAKFRSGCGWPSFDDEIKGGTRRILDSDGVRTEIVCAKCDAHLGHVFTGEKLTSKDTRHCVNSLSIKFISKNEKNNKKAYFASGCFWGTQHYFNKAKGVVSTRAGYTGGSLKNPTYEQVSFGKTGHVEAVEIEYDPSLTDYESLAKLFFETHDPTQKNGQGPDIGPQYASKIFYSDPEEKVIAERLVNILKEKGMDVSTKIEKAGEFFAAEDYHQDYYEKKGGSPYCHLYRKFF